jgi:hypothetical protein
MVAAALAVTASMGLGVPARAGDPSDQGNPGYRTEAPAAPPTLGAAAAPPPGEQAPLTDLAALEKRWGISALALRHTASGYMLDLRFRVVDPTLAAPLLSREIERKVIVDKSGAVLKVPFTQRLGSLRSAVRTPSMVKADRVYSALFANPGRHVKPGDTVSLVLGDFKADLLAVQ